MHGASCVCGRGVTVRGRAEALNLPPFSSNVAGRESTVSCLMKGFPEECL